MKTLAWLAAGIGVGLVVYLFATAEPEPLYSTGFEDLDDVARNAAGWGTKQRVAGFGTNIAGRVREGLGNLTGDTDLADSGVADEVAGNVREGVGKFAQAAGQTLHDLNR